MTDESSKGQLSDIIGKLTIRQGQNIFVQTSGTIGG